MHCHYHSLSLTTVQFVIMLLLTLLNIMFFFNKYEIFAQGCLKLDTLVQQIRTVTLIVRHYFRTHQIHTNFIHSNGQSIKIIRI